MEYERLTSRDEEYGIITLCDRCSWTKKGKPCTEEEMQYGGETVKCIDEVYGRLAELEDKIEDGTLVELERKIGDYVFFIDTFCLNMGVPSRAIKEGNIVKINATIQEKNIKYSYVVEYFERIFKLNDKKSHDVCSSDKVFTTKEDAEAKLKELREE